MPPNDRRVPPRFRDAPYFLLTSRPSLEIPESYLRRIRDVSPMSVELAVQDALQNNQAVPTWAAWWPSFDDAVDLSPEAMEVRQMERRLAEQVERQRITYLQAIERQMMNQLMGRDYRSLRPAGVTEQQQFLMEQSRAEQEGQRRREQERVTRESERLLAEYQAAEALLFRMITPEQQTQYSVEGFVEETAPSGRRWRLLGQMVGGVQILDPSPDGGWYLRADLCVHPEEALPKPALISALLMNIRTDEDEVIRRGNIQFGSFTDAEKRVRGIAEPAVAGCRCPDCRAAWTAVRRFL